MGCINTKLSKKKRRERKKLGLPGVKQFLRAKIDKHTKMATRVIPIQITPTESQGSVVKSGSNMTYTSEIGGNSCDRPVESRSNVETVTDLFFEPLPSYYRVDSVLRLSCSSVSVEGEGEDEEQSNVNSQSARFQTMEHMEKDVCNKRETNNSDPITRPEAPQTQTATIDVSPPPYLIPGYIEELDKDLEFVLSNQQPNKSYSINVEETCTKNITARPKAAKGVRTPHSTVNSVVMKPSTTISLPGCLKELDEDIESLLNGNSDSCRGSRVPKRSRAAKSNCNFTVTKPSSSSLPGSVPYFDEEMENLPESNSMPFRGSGTQVHIPRPKAAKGERTLHTNFTDNDFSVNLPGTAMPSTTISHQLTNNDVRLVPNISPRKIQHTVRGAKPGGSRFINNWM